jgi:hypothetical protein
MADLTTLDEAFAVLLDHAQSMLARRSAAAFIRHHGDPCSLDELRALIRGPWQREDDPSYLDFRREAAETAVSLWNRLQGGPPVSAYYPSIQAEVEGLGKTPGQLHRGRIACGFGTSMYEFHHEYPIEGTGVRKDTIVVLEADGSRTPVFEWCRRRDVLVVCTRCGEDITYQVNVFGCRMQILRGVWRMVLDSHARSIAEARQELDALSNSPNPPADRIKELEESIRQWTERSEQIRQRRPPQDL